MGIRGFAEYLAIKYAEETNKDGTPIITDDPPISEIPQPALGSMDDSLGSPIPAETAQRWKDGLILVYDRIKQELTTLPIIQRLYVDLQEELPLFTAFNNTIDSYITYIANSNLRDAFLFSIRYVSAFNDLRDKLPSMVRNRDKMHRIDEAIFSTQNYIWKKTKALLNIHDIGDEPIPLGNAEVSEMNDKLKEAPRGTWNFGHLKNPTKPMFRKIMVAPHARVMNRILDSKLYDEVRDRKGPYATDEEIRAEVDRIQKEEKKQHRKKIVDKHNKSLPGKDRDKYKDIK